MQKAEAGGKAEKLRIGKKLLNNLGLKLISVMIAVVLWFLVVIADNPKETRTFANIPVTLTNVELLEKENKVYEVLDNSDSVRVTVEVPRSDLDKLRASDIVAEADVSRLTDINTIPITYSVLNVGVDSDSVKGDHDVVRLNIEQKVSKWVKVKYITKGEVAEGYIVADTTADQTLIEVSGPESAVNRIDHAGVEIDVAEATRSQSANVEVLLYDAENQVLEFENVLKNVNYVHMEVEVLAVKTVPVEVSASGTPAAGFLATGVVESNPAEVRIAGSASALGNISRIAIPKERIILDGAEGDVVNVINIRDLLPENVRLADSDFNGRVTVTAYVEPEMERTLQIPKGNVNIVNIPEELTAEISDKEEYFELKISGLEAVVSLEDQNAIAGTADINAWMVEEGIDELLPGTYDIPIYFGISEAVKLEGEVKAEITFAKVAEE